MPNAFSIYVKRKGQYLIDVHGIYIATIDFPLRFRNLIEGVEVEMTFRPRGPAARRSGHDRAMGAWLGADA